MEDIKTRMLFHGSAIDNGNDHQSQVYKTDKVNSPVSGREVKIAAADETTGGLGSGEGSGSGATSNQNVINGKKRGRGRPRKHEGVSNIRSPGAFPPPTASSMPSASMPRAKRSRGRPKGSGKHQALAPASHDGGYLDTTGGAFTPLVAEAAAGEDVISKIKSVCLKGSSRWVCVFSATGAVSTVTIFRIAAIGTLTYEGWFQILTLTGSFLVSYDDEGVPCFKNWNLSISLADCGGRVFGGKLAGPLIAAGPGSIQLVLGCFNPNMGSNIKKKNSAGRCSTSTNNNLACSLVPPNPNPIPSQVSGMASSSPSTPHVAIKEDPLKVVPLNSCSSHNIVAENHNFNSTSLESVGQAGAMTFQKHDLNSSLKGVGPNYSLQKADLMKDNNNVTAEINDLNSSALKSIGPNNIFSLPVSQPKSDGI